VSRFWQDAENLLETAVQSSGERTDMAILVSPSGGIRIQPAEGWSTAALAAESGAQTLYRVSRNASGVRIEGRSGADRCLLEKELPALTARRLLGGAPHVRF
jgi:hypothetical protein